MPFLDNPAVLQFIKYALTGGLATVVHIVIFHLVCWKIFPALQAGDLAVKYLHLNPAGVDNKTRSRNSMLGNFTAFLISNMVAYITNVLWVFQGGRHTLFVEILLFYAVSGISIFLGTILMGWLIRRFNVLTTWAFACNIFTSVMINYALRKFFIFAG